MLALILGFSPSRTLGIAVTADEDPIDAYLEKHGLPDLVVARLERQLQEALGDEKVPIAERLAVLYGRMLDETSDEAQRAEWERRSRALLENVPKADTKALRLTIHKATYLRAERLAERYRLRDVGEDGRLEALRLMGEAATAFTESHRDLRARIRRIEDSDVGAEGEKSAKVEAELRQLDSLAVQTAYFGAWARYYQAWLANTTEGLDEAGALLGYVLQAPGAQPVPEDVYDSSLELEFAARSVVGLALINAQAGKVQTALAWLRLLEESSTTHPAAAALLPGYRLVILFTGRRWPDVDAHLAALHEEGRYTATLARLAAVLALQVAQATGDADARRLAQSAINDLSEMGQMRQVVEVAQAFSLDKLGSDRFVVAYVLALQAHEAARAAHGHSDDPATDEAVRRQYAATEELLRRVASHREAREWPEAAGHARLLAAWSLYYQDRLREAAQAFEAVAADLPRDTGEDALWMTVVCFDRLRSTAPEDEALRAELDAAMTRFLDRYPSSARAARVQYRQVVSQSGAPDLKDVERLLAIPPGSEVYASARDEAERMLYLIFHDASAGDQVALGPRYLQVALPLLEADQRRALLGAPARAEVEEARTRYLQRARRVLDVALTRGVSRLIEARALIDRLETARAAGLIDLSAIAGEIDYRRFQLRLLSGEFDEAQRWADALWQADPQSPFALAAARELHGYAAQDWHAYPSNPDLSAVLDRVVEYGRRYLSQFGDPPDAKHPHAVGPMLDVAQASLRLSESRGDVASAALAEVWLAQLLAARPGDYRVLKASAEIAERRTQPATAAQHWRSAMNAAREDTDEWYEAKYHFLRLLLSVDRPRAVEALTQHALLHPTFGPAPWGERLRELHRAAIGGSPGTSSSSPAPATNPAEGGGP